MFDLHASELARLQRLAARAPRPGSLEESRALAQIDAAREEELAETFGNLGRSRRRLRRHWSDLGAQLDGH